MANRSVNTAILVVEDEALVLWDIAESLREFGFVVYEAASADNAIRLMEAHLDIRTLVTDIDMPGKMDGLKLAAYVRDRWPPVRIVVVSGRWAPQRHELPTDAIFLSKPYEVRHIADFAGPL